MSAHFAAMSTLYDEVKAAEQAAFAVVGHEFNLGSPKHLQEVLFNELGMPKTKWRIKTGYTTDSEALTSLLAQTGHPLLEHLLRHRDLTQTLDDAQRLDSAGDDKARSVTPSAAGLLTTAARLLPVASRDRYAEEYRSELWEITQAGAGRIAQLRYAFRQLCNSIPMGVAVRSLRRKSSASG
jgi:DNA polymerase family A